MAQALQTINTWMTEILFKFLGGFVGPFVPRSEYKIFFLSVTLSNHSSINQCLAWETENPVIIMLLPQPVITDDNVLVYKRELPEGGSMQRKGCRKKRQGRRRIQVKALCHPVGHRGSSGKNTFSTHAHTRTTTIIHK